MTFRVGQKVVCMKARALRNAPGVPNVVVGVVYTVRDVVYFPDYGEGLRLQEIINPLQYTIVGRIEQAYSSDRFRPVVEGKTGTGMAILRKLLKTKQREDA